MTYQTSELLNQNQTRIIFCPFESEACKKRILQGGVNFGFGPLANSPRQPQHKDQHFGDRLVKLRWNFIAEFDLGECARQHFVRALASSMIFSPMLPLPLATTRGAPFLS